MINCTLAWNTDQTGRGPGAIWGTGYIHNSILWGNLGLSSGRFEAQLGGDEISLDYSCVEGLTNQIPGVGNLGASPLLDLEGRLSAGSPCIDAGDSGVVPADWFDLDEDGDTAEPIPQDIDRLPRFRDDPSTPEDETGMYWFTDVPAGKYNISEKQLAEILKSAIEHEASDVHLVSGHPPKV